MYLEIFKNMFNKMDKFIILNRGKTNWIYRLRYGTGIAWNYLVYNATISDYFELRFFEKIKKKNKNI